MKSNEIQVSNSNINSHSHLNCNRAEESVFHGRRKGIIVFVSLALALFLASSFLIAPVQADTYIASAWWGSSGTSFGYFDLPTDIAVDRDGFVYVADTRNHRIQKFTSDGSFVTAWGSFGSNDGLFHYTMGVAVDGSGYVYVADHYNSRIQKFTSTGVFVSTWGSYGSGDGQFDYPSGVAVDSLGYVYVIDQARVQKFTSTGVFVSTWGSGGSGDGQFNLPSGVAVDSLGYVYVSDTYNDRVQKFTGSGVFVTAWGGTGSGDGQFDEPGGVAVDVAGNVYVPDSNNNRVQKFTSTGVFVSTWGSYGSGVGQFDEPEGVAVDGSGNVYVSDFGNDWVQKFRVVYDVSFGAWSTPGWAVLPITVDGFSTGLTTPHTFAGLNGIHNFTVPEYYDYGSTRYFFTYWMKDGSILTNERTLPVGSEGTYHAHYTSVLNEFDVTVGENTYVVSVCSNLNVSDLSFDGDLKKLRLALEGAPGTRMSCNVTVPKELMSGDFSVYVDTLDAGLFGDGVYTESFNDTHYSFRLSYLFDSHIVEIYSTVAIPDFVAWLFLPFLISATLLGLALRKRLKKPSHLV